jgi:hypothetical protein
MRKLSETVIVETPIEVISPTVTTPGTTVIETPGEAMITNPTTVIQGATVVPGTAQPPATAQAQPQLRPRATAPANATPGVIISEPIDKPAVNPLQPGGGQPAEPELKLQPPSTPSTGAAKPGSSNASPALKPPISDAPPLEALPEEIPQNSRKDAAPGKPRSA